MMFNVPLHRQFLKILSEKPTWWNVQCDIDDTHTHKDYIQYCMRPFDYGIYGLTPNVSLLFCHVTNLLSGAPQLRVCFGWPIWSRSVQLSHVVYLPIDVSVKSTIQNIQRHSTNCSTTFWNNRRQSKCGGNEHIENRSLNSRELSKPFTQIQLIRCCETIGWIWVQRRVDTLLSDGACWNGSCLPSCRKRNSTCLQISPQNSTKQGLSIYMILASDICKPSNNENMKTMTMSNERFSGFFRNFMEFPRCLRSSCALGIAETWAKAATWPRKFDPRLRPVSESLRVSKSVWMSLDVSSPRVPICSNTYWLQCSSLCCFTFLSLTRLERLVPRTTCLCGLSQCFLE